MIFNGHVFNFEKPQIWSPHTRIESLGFVGTLNTRLYWKSFINKNQKHWGGMEVVAKELMVLHVIPSYPHHS